MWLGRFLGLPRSYFKSVVPVAFTFSVFIHFVARGDVSVSPVALYLGDSSRTGRITVTNKGDRSRAIQVDIRFGYPISDDSGNLLFRFVDSADHSEPLAAGWISAFPREFILGVAESQVVVFVADPPSSLNDGEYWARPVITSRLTGAHPGEATVAHKIVISVNYRHGSTITGLTVQSVQAQLVGSKLCLLADLARVGNAAYLGNIACRLNNDGGRMLGVIQKEIAVYHSMRHRFEFDLAGLSEGSYIAHIESNTNRRGNAPGDIIPAPRLYRSLVISVVTGKGAKIISVRES